MLSKYVWGKTASGNKAKIGNIVEKMRAGLSPLDLYDEIRQRFEDFKD